MHPKYIPDLVADQSKQNYLDNNFDALKKVWPSLAGGKERGVKPGSKIKSDKTHEDWYLSYGAYKTF